MGSRFVSPQINSADAIALVGAIAAVTLTVLALVGIAPVTLTAIAAICTGAALLGHGAFIKRRIFALRSPAGATFEQAKLGETASDEVLGGACAIALGVLALIGIEPLLLLAIAAIAIGGALTMAGPTRDKLPHLHALQEKYATLRPTQTSHRHRARRRTSKRRGKSTTRAKQRAVSRMRIRKDKVTAPMTAKRRRDKSPHRSSASDPAEPKSLTELREELPPSPPKQATSMSPSSKQETSTSRSTNEPESIEDVEPLFEPEILAAAHANPAFADTTVIGRNDAANSEATVDTDIADPVAAIAAQAEAPEEIATRDVADRRTNDAPTVKSTSQPELATAHDAEADATELAAAPARVATDDPAPRHGGLVNAVRLAANALGKAKELKHKLDDALAAHPFEHRATAASERVAPDTDEHALVKYNELAHGTNALEALGHEHALVAVVHEPRVETHEPRVETCEPRVDTREPNVGSREPRVETRVGPSERDIEIDQRLNANERAIERDLQRHASANAVMHGAIEGVPSHHVLTADGSVYEPAGAPHVDETIDKGLAHEREALADAHHLVDKVQGEHEPGANKKLAAEKAREGDPTVDRHAGARGIDAAYQHEVVAKAQELEHELEHHLESEALDREDRAHSNDVRPANWNDVRPANWNDVRPANEAAEHENKRARIAEVEAVPTTRDEIHRERALFAGGVVWVVGGLASVVLGILAVAGVARPFVLVEVAFLVTGVSILVSSIANGARLLAPHDVRREEEEENARDVDDAIAQPPALHARARDRSLDLHR